MDIKPIASEADYEAALAAIEELFDAVPGTPDGDKLAIWTALVEQYEGQRHPIPFPDPIEAIIYHLESRGLTPHDLERYLGGPTQVAGVLGRKRPLTLSMIRRLHAELGLAADILIQPYLVEEAA